MRQEFERHRYVNKLPVVDVLLFQSNADYQVRYGGFYRSFQQQKEYKCSPESLDLPFAHGWIKFSTQSANRWDFRKP